MYTYRRHTIELYTNNFRGTKLREITFGEGVMNKNG
jgi:hypothetical protein